jgi:azurin
VLCYWRDRVPDALALLKVQANDEHPGVRLEAVRAASFFSGPEAIAIAQDAQKHPQDKFLEYTEMQTMATLTSLGKKDLTGANPAPANTTATALPDLSAAAMRRDLRDKGVQTIVVGTIPEQMLFDVKWFVVEAGKPVRVTLTNADAMPHNIVIGQPGSVTAIGTAAATLKPPADPDARAYVPDTPQVLQATKLVQRGESDTLNFNAPSTPGEYSFLCSFPGHYVRMYGVMLVVPSLDQFETKPTPPTDPLSGKPFDSQRQAPAK